MSRIHGTRAIIAETLTNASIAADAAIADTKMAQIITAGKVSVTAITGVLSSANGGTGVANSDTITIGGAVNLSGAFSTTGAFSTSLTQSANITLSLPGVNGTLATEEYVDALAQALDLKGSVRAATQAALPAVTAAGSGVGKTLTADAVGILTLDDISLVATDRVLVKDQANQVDNGIYVVTTAGEAAVAFVLTRAEDCDGSPANEVTGGMYTFVEQGTASAGNGYVAIHDGNIVVDTDAINMSQFSGAGQITAGNGLEKSGNTIRIADANWDDIQAIDTLNMAGNVAYGLVETDLQKLADLDVTAAELNELNLAGCVNADFVKLHNITSSAVQLSDVATLSKLASTAAGDGASLIGVEAIANMAASTVQAALAELKAEAGTATTNLGLLQTEVDNTQVGAGLAADGAYIQDTVGTHSITTSTSLADADHDLDIALFNESEARILSDGNIQTEIDAIETGAGLNADGTFTPAAGTYIGTAGSLKLADVALDIAVKANSDEVDAIEATMGAMIDANGDFVTITGSNYMGSAVDVEGALQALDAGIYAVANGAVAIVDYDALGLGNGATTLYTVTAAEFVAGSLKVFINGLLVKKGVGAEQVQETTPGSGTFTFGTAPAADDDIIVSHR